MLNIDKVRGIVRAKNGSHIPKFQHPAGTLNLGGITSLNIIGGKYYVNGTEVTKEQYDLAKIQKQQQMENFGKDILGKDTFNDLNNQIVNITANLTNPYSSGTMQPESQKDATDSPLFIPWLTSKVDVDKKERYNQLLEEILKNNNQQGEGTDSKTEDNEEGNNTDEKGPSLFKTIGGNLKQGAKDFISKNGMNIANTGLEMLGNSFNNVENSGGVNTAFAIGDTIANGLGTVNPVLGLAGKGVMAALKGINSLGGKKARQFSVNQNTANTVGVSYGGSMTDIMNAAQNSGKKYGMFSGKQRKKANATMNEAERQQNIMTNIADEAQNMQAMAGQEFNYTNYMFNMNGGYDRRYMRVAKQGIKIQDKIDLVKQRRTINGFINLNSKEVDWEPIITNPVEEFKEGGIIIYQDINSVDYYMQDIEDNWEPIITEYIEEFKEGGNIKEDLETPEIEETNQKNLIPEGALHKNKHHMEHTEGLTQKGIPVVDNDGEQQAEIELNEIIFTLEVTKKLEELYKEGTDEAAIEAGKLLVKEILFNTDDRTGLIAKCEKGGIINEFK